MTEPNSYRYSATAEDTSVRIEGHSPDLRVTTPDNTSGFDSVTPEQLYAAALAACVYQTLIATASTGDHDLGECAVDARVQLTHRGNQEYALSAEVDVRLPRVQDRYARDTLALRAVERCPMAKSVEVRLVGSRTS
ncbi:OsmC family protein [Rhodococcus sp. M8]|uniref:OsmC family protein n=1 Tax=Rhodococcus sp. M8 TaxID=1925550 RepID=UPI00092C2BD5|nr:OsmC family protein [Rhodococcus sp. M8]OLL19166.1 osmotically inducible protein OsmC [Rhodococcus sp. M8]QPG47856.1 OsmC family protein [Rhodococcus sp. M8]